MDPETWREVPSAPGYQVSDRGQVRGLRGWILRPHICRSGHPQIVVCAHGRKRSVWIHVLVMEAFVGPAPMPGLECLHTDGNPLNNTPSNLRWGTRRENIVDRIKHSRRAARSVLTYEQAEQVRVAYDGNRGSQKRLAAQFGVSNTVINRIVNSKTYQVEAACA